MACFNHQSQPKGTYFFYGLLQCPTSIKGHWFFVGLLQSSAAIKGHCFLIACFNHQPQSKDTDFLMACFNHQLQSRSIDSQCRLSIHCKFVYGRNGCLHCHNRFLRVSINLLSVDQDALIANIESMHKNRFACDK